MEESLGNKNRIIITVKLSKTTKTFIFWNLAANREINSFDLDMHALIMYDTNNMEYIIEDKQIIDVQNNGQYNYSYDVQ